MPETTVRLNPVALAELLRGPQGPVFRHLAKLGDEVKAVAKVRVGKRTGTLERSIVKRFVPGVGGEPTVIVAAVAPYALYHHQGTRPHVIEARSGKVLAFEWPRMGAGVFYFPRVNHPGTKPNRFLLEALEIVMRRQR